VKKQRTNENASSAPTYHNAFEQRPQVNTQSETSQHSHLAFQQQKWQKDQEHQQQLQQRRQEDQQPRQPQEKNKQEDVLRYLTQLVRSSAEARRHRDLVYQQRDAEYQERQRQSDQSYKEQMQKLSDSLNALKRTLAQGHEDQKRSFRRLAELTCEVRRDSREGRTGTASLGLHLSSPPDQQSHIANFNTRNNVDNNNCNNDTTTTTNSTCNCNTAYPPPPAYSHTSTPLSNSGNNRGNYDGDSLLPPTYAPATSNY
jgi:hypothetical protein